MYPRHSSTMLTTCRYSWMSRWWHTNFQHSMRCSPSLPRTVQMMFLVNFEGPFKGSQSIPTKTGFNRADDAFQGFFSHFFPISKTQKKAEFHHQCGDDLAGGNFLAERSSNSSCRRSRTPAHGRRRLTSWRSPSPLSRVLTFLDRGSELPGEEGQGDKVAYILMGLTAGNAAAGFRGGVTNTGIENILVLPAVTGCLPLLRGPAHRDGLHACSWVFESLFQRRSRRLGWPAVQAAAVETSPDVAGVSCASCCGSGNLPGWQRRP